MTRAVKWILIINLVMFFVAQFPAAETFLLHIIFNTEQVRPYQWVTYAFLHTEPLHLIFNMVCLFFVGITVEEHLRTREFTYFYLTCAIGGALMGYVVSAFAGGSLVVGASGAIYGLLYALYRIHPEVQILAFFVIPIKLKYFLVLMGLISFALIFNTSDRTAHFAHFGGLLTGIAWFRYSDSVIYIYQSWKSKRGHQEELKEEEIKKSVDQILEKISKEGMGALSKKERQFLNKASNRFKD
jgi:membrane associated rhomboid family serine protease